MDAALATLAETRERTHQLIAALDERELESVYSTLLSPLVWDLGHIAAFEDLWISRALDLEPLRPELIDVYDADATPRARRGSLPMLHTGPAFEYQAAVRERTVSLLESAGEAIAADRLELIIRHEQQHNETMLQALQIAHLPSALDAGGPDDREPVAPGLAGGLDQVAIEGGEVRIGAGAVGFAYDNERPRHVRELAPFRIARTPATNGDWLEFIDDGGYRRREWWSAEGWAWRERDGIERPGGWTADGRCWRLSRCQELDALEPVAHISFYEAEAFANSRGARLPTEFEWERAAAGTAADPYPWGAAEPSASLANLDQRAGGPVAAGSRPDGASAEGVLGLIGDVWEWTRSCLGGYPGFVAYPYREYSEQFFGDRYRVLRGGSWATRARVASATFRNWDLPQRRQIFSGVRLAWDGR